MLLNFATTLLLSALNDAVKNPARKEQLRREMMRVRDAINTVYG
jgi:hypothetical protein